MARDKITLSSLALHLPNGLGPSAFSLTPPPPCPALLTLDIFLRPRSVETTATGDSMLGLGVNYSAVSKAVYALATDPTRVFGDAWELLDAVVAVPLGLGDVESVRGQVELPRASLHAQGVVYSAEYTYGIGNGGAPGREGEGGKRVEATEKRCTLRDLRTSCIVGLHPHEKKEKQRLELDLGVRRVDWGQWDHKILADSAVEFVSNSTYGTIESLDHFLAQHLLQLPLFAPSPASPHPEIEITIRKPSAIPFATPGITITRTPADYTPTTTTSQSAIAGPSRPRLSDKRVFIAVGSNIGDSVSHISRAIDGLKQGGCELVGCSRLYESAPMYVEDQERFTNGVIEVDTTLDPMALLRLLKRTEREVGRTKTFTNGPRVIDLDLVFYGDQTVKIGDRANEEDEDGVRWLECPHASVREREFVLRPLADIASDFKHPSLGLTVRQLLDNLPKSEPPALLPIIPFSGPSRPLRLSLSSPATPHIMAIFNATPDSFSDGDPARTDATYAVRACENLISGPRPPAILDIGGMSTRPNSTPCTEEEELSRIIPLIKAIRASANPNLAGIPISIDTYRPTVARAAVEAGASCINDVRGGRETGMMETMAELNVPVVLMHSRGDSSSMTSEEMTDYKALGGVVQGVTKEMTEMVAQALEKGVKRWNIVLDPGLGFAKTLQGNLELLRHLPSLLSTELAGYPMLVGASRKGFVGKIVGREIASERGYGDAALNSWCVASGVVDLLRVHDVRGAGECVAMSKAIRDGKWAGS